MCDVSRPGHELSSGNPSSKLLPQEGPRFHARTRLSITGEYLLPQRRRHPKILPNYVHIFSPREPSPFWSVHSRAQMCWRPSRTRTPWESPAALDRGAAAWGWGGGCPSASASRAVSTTGVRAGRVAPAADSEARLHFWAPILYLLGEKGAQEHARRCPWTQERKLELGVEWSLGNCRARACPPSGC